MSLVQKKNSTGVSFTALLNHDKLMTSHATRLFSQLQLKFTVSLQIIQIHMEEQNFTSINNDIKTVSTCRHFFPSILLCNIDFHIFSSCLFMQTF